MIPVESLYQRLPVMLQQAACTIEGWRIRRHRYGSRFDALLRAAEERLTWPEERLREYRDQRLRAFVQMAREAALAYSGRPARFEDWPVVTKLAVQERALDYRNRLLHPAELRPVHTSGTTGAGLRFWATAEAQQEQWAVWWRYRRWHGLEPGTLCGYFGGRSVVPVEQTRPPFWRYDLAGRQILFSAYHFNDRNLPHYVTELRRRQPAWLHGYPSLLALLAAYILDRGLDLGYRIRFVTTGAENLMPGQREAVERAFGVRPRQHYGMAEGVANASECERGRIHVDEDFAFTEFLPFGGNRLYRVVGTNFTNPATPLVRYEVSDHVTLLEEGCPCGRPGRLIERIDGRQEDYVIRPDGARLGRLDHIFKDFSAVREAQIVQPAPGRVILRVVRGQHYGIEDERQLLAEARARLGTGMALDIDYVEGLERSAAGKLRFVVSHLQQGQLEPSPAAVEEEARR
jgi:phenylacetate-CoA ligase